MDNTVFFPQFNFDTIIITQILKRSIPNTFGAIKHDCIVLHNDKNETIFLKDSVTPGFENCQFLERTLNGKVIPFDSYRMSHTSWKRPILNPCLKKCLQYIVGITVLSESLVRWSQWRFSSLWRSKSTNNVDSISYNLSYNNSRDQTILKLRSFVHRLAFQYFFFQFP